MTTIPGLNFCPADETGSMDISSVEGNVVVPGSHWHGHCHTINDFEQVRIISEGSFGVIYKSKKKRTNEFYALKKYNMLTDSGIPKDVLREISLLSILQHENIISSFGTVAGKDLHSNYLILDYCPYSLNELIQKLVNEIYAYDVVKCIMKQLFEGLAYMHEATVIHRDIKDENLLFTDGGTLKISGLNASRFYNDINMTPIVSDITYRAPELLFRTKKYSFAVDMWSAGCVFAKLLLKRPLFTGNSQLEVLRSIFNVLGIPSESIWPGFSDLLIHMEEACGIIEGGQPYSELKDIFGDQPLSCQDLLKDLLIYYPEGRLSAKDCCKGIYITDLPHACSLKKLASILKTVTLPEDPEIEEKVFPAI